MSEEEAINNLKRYIEEDKIYKENNPKSDFDKFCIGHCKDIETVLGYVRELERENGYLRVVRTEYEYYTENTNLVTERMIKSIEKNTYKIEVEEGVFIDIKELYTKYKELEAKIKRYEKYLDNKDKKFKEALENEYQERETDYIPKQVIRDKIEELKKITDKYEKQMDNDEETDLCYEEVREYACKIETLQELLEED